MIPIIKLNDMSKLFEMKTINASLLNQESAKVKANTEKRLRNISLFTPLTYALICCNYIFHILLSFTFIFNDKFVRFTLHETDKINLPTYAKVFLWIFIAILFTLFVMTIIGYARNKFNKQLMLISIISTICLAIISFSFCITLMIKLNDQWFYSFVTLLWSLISVLVSTTSCCNGCCVLFRVSDEQLYNLRTHDMIIV